MTSTGSTGQGRLSARQRFGLLCALLAYVLTSAVVPAGYMAAPLGAGTPVHLCPGDARSALLIQALATPAMDHHHHHHGHGDAGAEGGAKGSAEPGCSFAGFGTALVAASTSLPDGAVAGDIPLPATVSRINARALWLRPPVRSPPA